MQTVIDKIFDHSSIFVESIHFIHCRFVKCQLIYSAEETAKFESCTFEECQWTFDGAAENTLLFLSDLYNGLGEEGRDLVETIFTSIRTGSVRTTETAQILPRAILHGQQVAVG